MAKARQQYFADEVTLQKESREFAIEPELVEKLDSIETWAQVNVIETVKVNWEALVPDEDKAVDIDVPLVEDDLYWTDNDAALSARQGRVLYDYIQNIQSRGRYLSNWNCATWLAMTNPSDNPYDYRAWDYYIVSNVSSGTNYKPDWAQYIINQASTTVETNTVKVSDSYIYDWTVWLLLINTEREIAVDSSLSTTSINPVENRVVTNALNTKQDILIAWTNIQIAADGKTISATDTTYSSLPAAEGGADVSLVTTGEKYAWNWKQDKLIAWNNISIAADWKTISAVDTTYSSLPAAQGWTNVSLVTTWEKYTWNNKQDELIAWTNIQIAADGKTISATDTTYTAWDGISISSGNVITNTATTFKPFPNTFDTTHTTEDFLDSIEALNLPVWSAYLWQVSVSDMPYWVTVQWDVEVYVYPQNVIYAIMRSAEIEPYQWEVNSYEYRWWEPVANIVKDTTAPTYATESMLWYDDTNNVYKYYDWTNWKEIANPYTAWTNVQINNNVISATDTTYSAGTNITIDANNEISAVDTTYTAGTNITIDANNEISATDTTYSAWTNVSIDANNVISATDTTYTAWPWISISNNNVITNTRTSAEWWNITWTLSDQTDLQNALNGKQNVLTAWDNITIGCWTVTESDMKGPCPSGYHVPTDMDWYQVWASGEIMWIWDTTTWWDIFSTYLHLPMWYYDGSLWTWETSGWNYWSSTDYNWSTAYYMYFDNNNISSQGSHNKSYYFMPIRAFKNEPVIPDSSWTTVYQVADAWIYYNSTLWLISITPDGDDWYTLMDKNLWATTVYNYWDTVTATNLWNVYQWWNNYWFSWDSSQSGPNPSGSVNVSLYWPGNYFESDTPPSTYTGDSSNMWWWVSQWTWQSQDCSSTYISATDTKYTAGTWISIDSNNVISNTQTSAEWWNITGTLADQTDLNTALSNKANTSDVLTLSNTTSYTPTWDYNPATKKYVDDTASSAAGWAVSDAAYNSNWNWVTNVAPSKNAVYDKLNSDLNTKTFVRDGTPTTAQWLEVWGWVSSGNTAMIMHRPNSSTAYTMYVSTWYDLGWWMISWYAEFTSIEWDWTEVSVTNTHSEPAIKYILLNQDWSTFFDTMAGKIKYLATDVNYSTPYTPTYDGSPATKKYVDDNDTIVSSSVPTGTHTEWELWYDTANDKLKAFNWTEWSEVWATPPTATSSSLWLVKLWSDTAQTEAAQSPSSTTWRTYPVQLNSSNQMVVNVPWTDTTTWSATSSAAGTVKLFSDTQQTETAQSVSSTSGRTYWIQNNSSNQMVVNVPWTDTTYSAWTYLTLNWTTFDVDTSLIATKSDVANFAGFEVVATLPTSNIKTNIIYLLWPLGTWADKYEEYIYSNNNWIMIWETSIDLSPYFNYTTQTSDAITQWSTNLFLTSAERTILGNTSNTNTGDETKTTIQTKLWAASASNSWYLTSTDWSTFNGKANAVDVNTKTFYLSGTSDLTNAQAAYDWYVAWKNPIIVCTWWNNEWKTHICQWMESGKLVFYYFDWKQFDSVSWGKQTWYLYRVKFTISSWTVTAIEETYWTQNGFLNLDNTTAYTPSGDYNPATKKYVDDIKPISGSAAPSTTPAFVGQEYIDTTNNVTYIAKGTSSSSDWVALANDSNVVKLTWSQTITGAKTFDWVNTYTQNWDLYITDGEASWWMFLLRDRTIISAEKITNHNGWDFEFSWWGNNQIARLSDVNAKWDMSYSDYNWVSKTWATVTLDLASTITPSANFTVNAPSTIKDGQSYILRVNNWATAYTMTLGTNVTNPYSTSTTLTANWVDQFVFLAIGWNLELQPEWWGSWWGTWWSITGTLSDQTDLNTALGGKQATLVSWTNIKTINSQSLLGSWNISITSDITLSSQSNNVLTSWAKLWAWTQANYNALWTYDNNTIYFTY